MLQVVWSTLGRWKRYHIFIDFLGSPDNIFHYGSYMTVKTFYVITRKGTLYKAVNIEKNLGNSLEVGDLAPVLCDLPESLISIWTLSTWNILLRLENILMGQRCIWATDKCSSESCFVFPSSWNFFGSSMHIFWAWASNTPLTLFQAVDERKNVLTAFTSKWQRLLHQWNKQLWKERIGGYFGMDSFLEPVNDGMTQLALLNRLILLMFIVHDVKFPSPLMEHYFEYGESLSESRDSLRANYCPKAGLFKKRTCTPQNCLCRVLYRNDGVCYTSFISSL